MKNRDPYLLHPADDWHEDYSTVLWWHYPICEPPYIGTPIDCDWSDLLERLPEGWITHFSFLPDCDKFTVVPPPSTVWDPE